MTFRPTQMLTLLALTALAACNGESTTETDPDTDSGTEDPGPQAKFSDLPAGTTGFTGTMDYTASITGTDEGGAAVDESCAAQFAITGQEFAGACSECKWAFTVDATENSNDCGEDLDHINTLQVPQIALPGGSNVLTFWEEIYGAQETYLDVLALVTPRADGTLAYGDSIGLYIEDDAYGYGSFEVTETGLDWTMDYEYDRYRAPWGGNLCLSEGLIIPTADATAPLPTASSSTATGSLDCDTGDDTVFDSYSFTATAGDEITITVDTVAADSAFDTVINLVGPSGCAIGSADDSFECTFTPTDYQCSGLTFTAAETGEHFFLIRNFGSCTDGEDGSGSYIVAASGTTLSERDDGATVEDPEVSRMSDISIDVSTTFQ